MPSQHPAEPPRSSLLHRIRARGIWACLALLVVRLRRRGGRAAPAPPRLVPLPVAQPPVAVSQAPVAPPPVAVAEPADAVAPPPFAQPAVAVAELTVAVTQAPPHRSEPTRSSLLHRIFARRAWTWLMAALAVVAVALVQLAANDTTATYVSTGTYLVHPRAAFGVTSIQAAANLNSALRVNTTFARIVESELILDRAWESVRSPGSGAEVEGVEVVATVTPSANILSISVRTDDADTASAIAEAVGAETIRYVQGVDLYDLTVLDAPSDARRVSPDPLRPRTLLAAGLVGLGVGAATTPLARRRSSRRAVGAPTGLDTGISNVYYTRQRIREERSRSDHNGVPFHLLVVYIDVPPRRSASRAWLRKTRDLDVPATARAMSSALRGEDRLCYLGEHELGTFVVIAPGRTDEQADELAGRLQAASTVRLGRRRGQRVVATSQTCRYEGKAFHGDPDALRIADAL